MEEKDWKLLGMALVAALWLALTVVAWCRPPAEFSWRERRQLAQFPTVSKEKLLDGTFGADFEKYTLDQFPLRDGFRQLKARVHYDLLCQRDNNGIYLAGGQVAKLEYPMDTASLDNALAKFQRIYDRYLTGCKVYAAIVPDKGYYLAEANGYPAMDYGTFLEKMEQGMPYARYVNLTELLRGEDYYRTDTHWRQERLLPVANRLCAAMNLGGTGVTLFTNASVSDGGTLRYQWYESKVEDINEIRAIDGAEGDRYQVPETPGVMWYCYAAWNVSGGLESRPVYSRLIRVEFYEEAGAHTHAFGQWMVTTEATCTEPGIQARECDCGHTERADPGPA